MLVVTRSWAWVEIFVIFRHAWKRNIRAFVIGTNVIFSDIVFRKRGGKRMNTFNLRNDALPLFSLLYNWGCVHNCRMWTKISCFMNLRNICRFSGGESCDRRLN